MRLTPNVTPLVETVQMRIIIFVAVLFMGTQCFANIYLEASEKCDSGGAEACQFLKKDCDVNGGADSCFYFAIALGLKRDDEGALSYVIKSCVNGLDFSCEMIPKLRKFLEEKYEAAAISL